MMKKTYLPYKQFSEIDLLTVSERFTNNRNVDEKVILKNTIGRRPRRWSVDHIQKNKYFSYIPPLSSPYKPINNPFTDIKKKRRNRSNSLVNILYNINYKDVDNCNVLWSEIYDKSKKNDLNKEISWTSIFRNVYDNRRYNLFNDYSPEIDLKISSDDDL